MGIASNQFAEIPVVNGTTPKQPKALPLTLDFSNATGQAVQLIDLTNAQQRTVIDSVQSIFLDMSNMSQAVTVLVQGSNMIIVAEPGTQGFYPVLAPPPLRFTFTSTLGAGSLKVFLTNVNMPSSKWVTTPGGTGGTQLVSDVAAEASLATLAASVTSNKVAVSDANLEALITSGKLAVADPALEALITSGKLSVADAAAEASLVTLAAAVSSSRVQQQPLLTYSGSNVQGQLVANRSLVLSFTSSQSSVVVGVPGYYIQSVLVQLQPNSTIAGGGVFAVNLSDSSFGVFFGSVFYLPASYTALSQGAGGPQVISPGGFFWNNKVSNSTMSVLLNTSLSGGAVNITVGYGISSWVG